MTRPFDPTAVKIQALRIAVRLLNHHGRTEAALECTRVAEEIRRAERVGKCKEIGPAGETCVLPADHRGMHTVRTATGSMLE